jgi:hypothetical protein
MKLDELKKMISEEYAKYMKEQNMPAVAVSDKDVDADGSEDAEATLRDIYEMLKDFFEGGAADDAGSDDADNADDEEMTEGKKDDEDKMEEGKKDDEDKMEEGKDDDDKKEEAKQLQERFQKLANIIK